MTVLNRKRDAGESTRNHGEAVQWDRPEGKVLRRLKDKPDHAEWVKGSPCAEPESE